MQCRSNRRNARFNRGLNKHALLSHVRAQVPRKRVALCEQSGAKAVCGAGVPVMELQAALMQVPPTNISPHSTAAPFLLLDQSPGVLDKSWEAK